MIKNKKIWRWAGLLAGFGAGWAYSYFIGCHSG
jgi:hypothetical protein